MSVRGIPRGVEEKDKKSATRYNGYTDTTGGEQQQSVTSLGGVRESLGWMVGVGAGAGG